MILTGIMLLAFGAVVFLQILAPILADKPAYTAMAIHFRNGFYANALFDRIIGALRIHSQATSPTIIESVEKITYEKHIEAKRFEQQNA